MKFGWVTKKLFKNLNKIADALAKSYDGKITKVSKTSQQNNSETVIN